MKLGAMRDALPGALTNADVVFVYDNHLGWDVAKAFEPIGTKTGVFADLNAMIDALVVIAKPGDQILVMTNGGFGGVHGKILAKLAEREMKST